MQELGQFTVRLQPVLLDQARKIAESEGIGLDQLINAAFAEKLAAVRKTFSKSEPSGRMCRVRCEYWRGLEREIRLSKGMKYKQGVPEVKPWCQKGISSSVSSVWNESGRDSRLSNNMLSCASI